MRLMRISETRPFPPKERAKRREGKWERREKSFSNIFVKQLLTLGKRDSVFLFFDSVKFKQNNNYYTSYRNQAVLGENFLINENHFISLCTECYKVISPGRMSPLLMKIKLMLCFHTQCFQTCPQSSENQ